MEINVQPSMGDDFRCLGISRAVLLVTAAESADLPDWTRTDLRRPFSTGGKPLLVVPMLYRDKKAPMKIWIFTLCRVHVDMDDLSHEIVDGETFMGPGIRSREPGDSPIVSPSPLMSPSLPRSPRSRYSFPPARRRDRIAASCFPSPGRRDRAFAPALREPM
ncbi:MAG: hypothetical protein JWQ98_533 [Chlorobi bacterium]|nr:hypothetical protein [Chlorobiota bacterium]